jgi:hypothetical protein
MAIFCLICVESVDMKVAFITEDDLLFRGTSKALVPVAKLLVALRSNSSSPSKNEGNAEFLLGTVTPDATDDASFASVAAVVDDSRRFPLVKFLSNAISRTKSVRECDFRILCRVYFRKEPPDTLGGTVPVIAASPSPSSSVAKFPEILLFGTPNILLRYESPVTF